MPGPGNVLLGEGLGDSLLPSVSMCPVGIYTSNKDPISHGGGMLRAVCSTPLSSSLLGPPGTSALPRLSRSPFTSTLPSSSASISTTQVRTYPWAPPSLGRGAGTGWRAGGWAGGGEGDRLLKTPALHGNLRYWA